MNRIVLFVPVPLNSSNGGFGWLFLPKGMWDVYP